MKSYIIITSIFGPTEAVREFSKFNDFKLAVVGDLKSPEKWQNPNTTFLSIADQEKMNSKLVKVLPYNHYCRKMMGYLYAIEKGAEVIIDTDDDNIPKENWHFPKFSGQFECIQGDLGFINIYNYFTDQAIWPRGLPLRLINRGQLHNNIGCDCFNIGIWQGLADEDPDVDAIYRLTSDKVCKFIDRAPLVLRKGTLTPFNTQNTAVIKELFPLMYLPCHVTFRFTDILRGIVAQPIMWAAEYSLGFINATVIQKRNPHDYFKDFISEIPMYLHVEKVAELVDKVTKTSCSVKDNLFNSYVELEKEEIIISDELKILEAWLFDIDNITRLKY
ncbi:MAG: STELLO glycosyltransferase family protein [Solirubrobacterales bacterium]